MNLAIANLLKFERSRMIEVSESKPPRPLAKVRINLNYLAHALYAFLQRWCPTIEKLNLLDVILLISQGCQLRFFVNETEPVLSPGRHYTELSYDGRSDSQLFTIPLHWHKVRLMPKSRNISRAYRIVADIKAKIKAS